MKNSTLVQRLVQGHPGWDVWNELISLIKSLDFDLIDDEYLGSFYASGSRLTFSKLSDAFEFPDWLPSYVPALYGMNADHWEMAGGYASSFSGEVARTGYLFSPAGNDQDLGYPLIDVPADVYSFQSNSSGATFFINSQLEILYPDSEKNGFVVLDTLSDFSQKNIRQVLLGRTWFTAYSDLPGNLLD